MEGRHLVARLKAANVYAKAAYDLSFRRPEHTAHCIQAWENLKGRAGPGLLVSWIVGSRDLPEAPRRTERQGPGPLDIARASWRHSTTADDWFRTAGLIRAANGADAPDLERHAQEADLRAFELDNGRNPVLRTESRKNGFAFCPVRVIPQTVQTSPSTEPTARRGSRRSRTGSRPGQVQN